ncbi:uncharacterized protein LOC133199316 [Saccostrea echinata]|uniref:uncharacterized protein LOC133199316 n=1 Tax=Saccostrea echinata TaxID=191078 RepID=UPI002A833F42|nr:uncharacterized protein LOC133199316 [Saccostrea echinata]
MNSAVLEKLEKIEMKLDELLAQRESRSKLKRVHAQFSPLHKNALRKVHKRMMEDFHLESEIDNLIQHDVIGRETWEEIKCLGSRANQLRMFLLKLGSYDTTKFEAFLDVLKESHNHIADELISYMSDTKENDDILYEEDRMEISCIRCEISRRIQPGEVIDELFSSGIIGATALRKYIEPNSEFKGSKVWKYVFDNLKSLQRNEIHVSKMMQEALAKKYSDIAESRQLRLECSWDCTCEAMDPSTQGRLHSISDASSVIARKCESRSNTPDIFFETPFSTKKSEEKLTQPEEKIVSPLHTQNPEIVVTAEESVSGNGGRTESGYFDVDTEDSSLITVPKTITKKNSEQLLRPPQTEYTTRSIIDISNTYQRKEDRQDEIIYKNPCFDGFISSTTIHGEIHQKIGPEKEDMWKTFFPKRKSAGESGESIV